MGKSFTRFLDKAGEWFATQLVMALATRLFPGVLFGGGVATAVNSGNLGDNWRCVVAGTLIVSGFVLLNYLNQKPDDKKGIYRLIDWVFSFFSFGILFGSGFGAAINSSLRGEDWQMVAIGPLLALAVASGLGVLYWLYKKPSTKKRASKR